MQIYKLAVMSLALLAGAPAASAQFFDTSEPEELFNLGVRLGVNTSVQTANGVVGNFYNKNSWGTGVELGVVASINIREYLSLQPGFFIESRSGDFTYINAHYPTEGIEAATYTIDVGHYRRCLFNIPILASVHFNVSDDIRWDLDFGPYFSFSVGQSTDRIQLSSHDIATLKYRTLNFGFKMGSGLQVKDHYYFGIHYLAGCTGVWKKETYGGRNKAWTFTLGYDF